MAATETILWYGEKDVTAGIEPAHDLTPQILIRKIVTYIHTYSQPGYPLYLNMVTMDQKVTLFTPPTTYSIAYCALVISTQCSPNSLEGSTLGGPSSEEKRVHKKHAHHSYWPPQCPYRLYS